MSTKAEIETQIDTDLANASSITASDHRNTLRNGTHNILDTLYPTVLTDSNATSTYLTWGASSSWSANICKIGRAVHLNVSVTANGTMQLNAATIAAGDFTPDSNAPYQVVGRVVGGGYVIVVVGAAGISFLDPIMNGETVVFGITYNTAN
jgi:hypothetical protein